MATLLDIGLLSSSGMLFPFLFIVVMVYAILAWTKLFGENKALPAFLSFVLGIMTIISPIAVKTINRMAPWFVLLFIFTVFLMLAFMTFGVEGKTIKEIVIGKEHGSTVFLWVIALVLIIGIGSLTSVYSEEKGFKSLADAGDDTPDVEGEPAAGTEDVGFFATLFHPKVLGMVLLLLVAFFTVRNLAAGADK